MEITTCHRETIKKKDLFLQSSRRNAEKASLSAQKYIFAHALVQKNSHEDY